MLSNQQIFNFASLKEQVIVKALSEDVQLLTPDHATKKRKLTLHNNEIIMHRKQFDILVEQNKGKTLTLTYDKRKIMNPLVNYIDVTVIDTLPLGHRDLGVYELAAAATSVVYDSDMDV